MKKVLRKSNLMAGILILIVVCLGIVLAEDVVVRNGIVTSDEVTADKITGDEITADVFKDRALVGYWQFNDNATDSTMYQNNGTFAGNAHAQQGVLELDGIGDYVSCYDAQSLDLENNFSISVWFKTDNTGFVGTVICKGDVPAWSSGGAYTVFTNVPNGEIGFSVRKSNNNGTGGAAAPISYDEWVHVVGTFSDGDIRIYKNGTFVADDDLGTSTINTNNDSLGIGAEGDGGGLAFWGSMDDLMVFDRVLEDWEIEQLYKNPKRDGYFNELTMCGDLDAAGTVTMGKLVIPTKSTTGDPVGPAEGQIYTNTADNKVRVYSDGAWRDLATW
jgi:hypothetical protein